MDNRKVFKEKPVSSAETQLPVPSMSKDSENGGQMIISTTILEVGKTISCFSIALLVTMAPSRDSCE